MLTELNFFDSLATQLSNLFTNAFESLFGPSIRNPLLGNITTADLAFLACFLIFVWLANILIRRSLRGKIQGMEAKAESATWQAHLFGTIVKPLEYLIWICGCYLAITALFVNHYPEQPLPPSHQIFRNLFNLGVFLVVFWVFFRLTNVIELILASWTRRTKSKLDDVLISLLTRSLRVIVPVMGVMFALPLTGFPEKYAGVVATGSSILLICAVAWILFAAVQMGEKAVLAKYDISAADNLHARKLYTQVHVLGKAAHFLIALLTVSSILMLFEEVRRFGTSILASAGVIGVIMGFAAQRTIANLFAGFQLAMTQPIRLDDVVIVEGEWGRIEEITLTYVVIRIWDERRLIVPLSYFIEKPFQNWTRSSAQLMGAVFLWVDYTLPLEEVRKVTKQIVEENALWDKRFWNLQVTDSNERAMQIRILATTTNSSNAWTLRCEIREKLITYIQKHHPQHLPLLRTHLNSSSSKDSQASRLNFDSK